MVDIEKLAHQVSKLTNELHRLQQAQLEMQKELISYKLQAKLKEWKEENAHLASFLKTTTGKLNLH